MDSISFKGIQLNNTVTKFITEIGNASAAKRRLIIGVGALATKPAIDYFVNRSIDEKTRKYSSYKTAAKVIIGTTTGVTARTIGHKVGKALIESGKIINPYRNALEANRFVNGIANTTAFLATLVSITCLDLPLMSKVIDKISADLKPKAKDSEAKEVVA